MGLCHYSKKQLGLAATCFEEACALNRSYHKASIWLQRVRQEIDAVLVGDVSAVPTQPVVQQFTGSAVHEQVPFRRLASIIQTPGDIADHHLDDAR